MKTYGSAVFTALQAQYMSINEISQPIRERRFEAFLFGGSQEGWLDCFWHTMAILQANKTGNKMAKAERRF